MNDRVRQLELKLLALKQHNDELVEVDSYERWGPKGADAAEVQQYVQRGRVADEGRTRVVAELTAELSALKTSAPEVIATWAAGHLTLLGELRASYEADPRLRVLVPRVDDEVKAWREVLDGERLFVEPWRTGVSLDPRRRAEVFGA